MPGPNPLAHVIGHAVRCEGFVEEAPSSIELPFEDLVLSMGLGEHPSSVSDATSEMIGHELVFESLDSLALGAAKEIADHHVRVTAPDEVGDDRSQRGLSPDSVEITHALRFARGPAGSIPGKGMTGAKLRVFSGSSRSAPPELSHARFMNGAPRYLWLVVFLAACGWGEPRTSETSEPARPSANGRRGDESAATPSTPFVAVRAPSDESLLEAPAHALGGEGALEQIAATYPLRIVRVRAQSGDRVEAGAPIVEVTSALVFGAAATYRSSSERLAVVEERLAAVRALRDQRAASADQVFDLESRAADLRGVQREALATLRSAGLTPSQATAALARGSIVLESAHAGTVRDMHAVPGEVHPDGQVFATLVTGPSRRIEARFPGPLGEGFRFEFEDLFGRRHPLGDRPFRTLEAGEEGGVLVWFDLPEGTALAPDAPGHVHALPVRSTFVEIPVGALHPIESGAEVLRRRSGAISRVPVTVVASSGSSAIVEGDLRIGDEVSADASGTIDSPASGEP